MKSVFRFNNLTGLQVFQLLRYSTFVLIGIGFAKLNLRQTDIGQFETFVLISGMVSFFWVSGIINSMLAIYPQKSEDDKKTVLFNTFLSLAFFSLLAGVLLFVFAPNLLAFLDKSGQGSIIKLSIAYLLLNNPSFITEYVLFLNNRSKDIVGYGFVTTSLTVLAALLPALLQYPMVYSMYALILTSAIRLIFAIWILSRFAAFNFQPIVIFDNLRLSTPLMLSIFVSGSAEYIDGMIVKSRFNDMFFAIYRYGAKELPALLIIANTFSTAMIPSLAADLNEGLKELKAKSARLMHWFFPITIALMLGSSYIYRYVFNENFVYSALIFNIYLLLIIPRVLFPQTILTALKQTRFLLLSSVLEIGINVLLSLYLSTKMGLPGIAIGTLIAYSFDKIFLALICKFYLKTDFKKYVQIIPYFVYVILTVVSFFLSLKMMHDN